MKIEAGSRVVFIGDSITDCGRARPVAEGPGGLGGGYVSLVDAFFTDQYPERMIRTFNMGISGDTVRLLKARWQTDVVDLAPDYLSILIGTNDVWRHFDSCAARPETHIGPDEFRETYEELILRARPGLKGLLLLSPFYLEPHRGDPMRAKIDEYAAIVRGLAGKYKATYVDLAEEFDARLERRYSCAYSGDRVHPNLAGHLVIARTILRAVGFSE